jgi:hypothetical protein
VSTDGSFCGGEANRTGDEYPAPSGEEVKKEWSCTFSSLYSLISLCLIKQRYEYSMSVSPKVTELNRGNFIVRRRQLCCSTRRHIENLGKRARRKIARYKDGKKGSNYVAIS